MMAFFSLVAGFLFWVFLNLLSSIFWGCESD